MGLDGVLMTTIVDMNDRATPRNPALQRVHEGKPGVDWPIRPIAFGGDSLRPSSGRGGGWRQAASQAVQRSGQ